ncbi:MAG: hypothetical protein KAR20_13590, partial [Candidatus Heimdallarchaeota archaeon]|nr:hypothetical protein [Candidatus Heimdallarchaeota archaeon]
MLIDILKKIFNDNHFEELKVEFDSGEYHFFLTRPGSAAKRQEYYLVLEKENTTIEDINMLIETGADNFFEVIRKSDLVDESFEKNCTIIFSCGPSERAIEPEIILRLEEDPYNFKKNVIEYTSEELDSWNDVASASLSVERLNEMMGNGETFASFKEGGVKDSYSLLMKISMKLPFIHY